MTDYARLTGAALHSKCVELSRTERSMTAELVACLSEVERQEVHLEFGYGNIFEYLVRGLGYSEGAAGRRLGAMRVARQHPEVYSYLRGGGLSLSTVCRLDGYLTRANASGVLSRASGLSRRKLDELLADLESQPVPVTRSEHPVEPELFASSQPIKIAARSRKRDQIRVPSPGRVSFSFEGSEALRDKLERAEALLAVRLRSRRLEDLVELMADIVLSKLDPSLKPSRRSPPPVRPSRRIPWAVRREVWARDGGRCAYSAEDGTRCAQTRALQYDHVTPWALGGRSDEAANIRLLCRAHNLREGRKAFPEATARALAARAAAGGARRSAESAPTSSVP
jgi:hypothetical protein